MLRSDAGQRPYVGRRRRSDSPIGWPGRGVGVLADDQHPHVGQRPPERLEDVVAGRAGSARPAASSARRNCPIAAIRSSTGASASAQSGAISPRSTQPGEGTHATRATPMCRNLIVCHAREHAHPRRATVADLRELAGSMPGVTIERGPKGNDVYQVSRRLRVLPYAAARRVRPRDRRAIRRRRRAVGRRRGEKQSLVADVSTPFFTTSHFDGHPSVLLRTSRIGELSHDELAEVVYDAWLARASKTAARKWLDEHGVR